MNVRIISFPAISQCLGIKGAQTTQIARKKRNRKNSKILKNLKIWKMKFILLLITMSLGCLIQKKQTVHQVVAPKASQGQRSRAKRDLIGYNRQRNTAHHSRFKLLDTNHMERYKRKIAKFIMKTDRSAIERFRRRTRAIQRQQRAKLLKQLGYWEKLNRV